MFLNLGLTHTKHPETGARNLGMYRLQQQDSPDGQPALADPQGLHLACRDRRAARRAAAGGDRVRLPAGGDLRRVRAAAGRHRRVPVRRLPAARTGRAGGLPDACRCRCRPHAQVVLEGWVEPGARLPEGPFGDHTGFYTPVEPFPFLRVETDDHAAEPDLPVDRRRPAAAGGRPAGQGHRADLPAADQADRPRDRGLRPARGRGVPQLLHRLDRQALSQARAQGDERDLGRRAAVAVEADRGGRRRLRRARLHRGRLAGVRQRRLRPRRGAHDRAGGPPRPRVLRAVLRRQAGHRRHRQAGRPRATGAPAAGPSQCVLDAGDRRRWWTAAGPSTASTDLRIVRPECSRHRKSRSGRTMRAGAAGRLGRVQPPPLSRPHRARSGRSCGW